MNLKEETLEALRLNGKSLEEILWIGSKDYFIEFDETLSVLDVEYDNGFGAAEIAVDLVVVGKDFWLERFEYHGAEGWNFKEKPKNPDEILKKPKVSKGIWDSLKELNGKENAQ